MSSVSIRVAQYFEHFPKTLSSSHGPDHSRTASPLLIQTAHSTMIVETRREEFQKLYCYAFTHIHTCSPNTTTLHMFYYPSVVMLWPHIHAFRDAGITRLLQSTAEPGWDDQDATWRSPNSSRCRPTSCPRLAAM